MIGCPNFGFSQAVPCSAVSYPSLFERERSHPEGTVWSDHSLVAFAVFSESPWTGEARLFVHVGGPQRSLSSSLLPQSSALSPQFSAFAYTTCVLCVLTRLYVSLQCQLRVFAVPAEPCFQLN